MYTGPYLIDLLHQKHQQRGSALFCSGTYYIKWRAKVGSYPHPSIETLISAGEPAGIWDLPEGHRPEDKRNVNQNWSVLRKLPLNGYIPGSSIRGIVRSWALNQGKLKSRAEELLGVQKGNTILPGRIQFLDAWPLEPTHLSLDIINPQQDFQVFHKGQGKPVSLYALGDGKNPIPFRIAIQGIGGKASQQEVSEVWSWVQQALSLHGLGSRTASGYGRIHVPELARSADPPIGISRKVFEFTLLSQGNYGPSTKDLELRPSHWRGWLRSWLLRFFLGVMSQDDAKQTVGELLGKISESEGSSNDETRKGCVRLELIKGETWGEPSKEEPSYYTWKGQLCIEAPGRILDKIILPIIVIAASVGGVGRGWRRPLHLFMMEKRGELSPASRGCQLSLKIEDKDRLRNFRIPFKSGVWNQHYDTWHREVREQWSQRVSSHYQNPQAEVFSPVSCSVYILPGPREDPIERDMSGWVDPKDVRATRGKAMELIYRKEDLRNYKGNPDLGGQAGAGDSAHCSWASIKRVNIKDAGTNTECQEIVCLFMGGKQSGEDHVRSKFLQDLSQIQYGSHLFGLRE